MIIGYSLQIGDNQNNNIGFAAFGGHDGTRCVSFFWFMEQMLSINDGKWHCLVGTAGDNIWSNICR
ncbi:MAG: hypothetical protein IPG12_11495 [Saprospiraceae bacterium]|nr:hypothetical protein [Saprospiraceae bacterium]